MGGGGGGRKNKQKTTKNELRGYVSTEEKLKQTIIIPQAATTDLLSFSDAGPRSLHGAHWETIGLSWRSMHTSGAVKKERKKGRTRTIHINLKHEDTLGRRSCPSNRVLDRLNRLLAVYSKNAACFNSVSSFPGQTSFLPEMTACGRRNVKFQELAHKTRNALDDFYLIKADDALKCSYIFAKKPRP